MTWSLSGAEWLLFLLKGALAAIPPSLLLWLWREMTAHSLYLYAQRLSLPHAESSEYRFAIQNNEDVPLGEHTVRIEILDDDGYLIDGPEVYAGCNRIKPHNELDRRFWEFTFDELPPYETWTIDCKMSAAAKNIRLVIKERSTSLSGHRLFLAADQISALTPRRMAMEWWWSFLAILLALATYAVTVVLSYGAVEKQDWPFLGAIAVFGVMLYFFSRLFGPRVAPPVTQGYWDAVKMPLI